MALLPTPGGCALFFGDGRKVALMYIDPAVGLAINITMSRQEVPRPLTHDLIKSLFDAHDQELTRVTIEAQEGDVYFSKMLVSSKKDPQGHLHLIDLDCRPSDAVAMAVRTGCPIYFKADLWNRQNDVSKLLEELQKSQREEEDDEDEEDDSSDEQDDTNQ